MFTRVWRVCAVCLAATVTVGCAQVAGVDYYAPAQCQPLALEVDTFAYEQINMPGFMQGVFDAALPDALIRKGLLPAEQGDADVLLTARFEFVDLNPATTRDSFDEAIGPDEVTRFDAKVHIEIIEQATARVIWTGVLSRAHAITGYETFHSDRAVLATATALDGLLDGFVKPCAPS